MEIYRRERPGVIEPGALINERRGGMEKWTLHWLEASGSLAELRRELVDEFDAAYEAIARLMPPPRLDVLIQRLPGETIP